MSRRHIARLLTAALLILPVTATAGEATLYQRLLDRYDANKDGQFSKEEADKISADALAGPTEPDDLAAAATPTPGKGPAARKDAARCGFAHHLYIRRDDLDLSSYTGLVPKADAKGASLSAWRDDESDTDQWEAHGMISWVATRCLVRPADRPAGVAHVSSLGLAPFLALDGVRSDNPDDDKSALRAGVGFQAAIFEGPVFDLQAFTLAPYFQSDFRGEASAVGAALGWEPYRIDWNLGATLNADGAAAYWRLKLDADWLRVDKAGRTDLKDGTDYGWMGGSVGLVVFPPMPKGWRRRLQIYGDMDLHRDVRNDIEARLQTVGAAINLNEAGDIALSLERSWGEDRKTLKEERKTSLSLDFKM
jgi:hypothetical protein